jgi:hypothetical protein
MIPVCFTHAIDHASFILTSSSDSSPPPRVLRRGLSSARPRESDLGLSAELADTTTSTSSSSSSDELFSEDSHDECSETSDTSLPFPSSKSSSCFFWIKSTASKECDFKSTGSSAVDTNNFLPRRRESLSLQTLCRQPQHQYMIYFTTCLLTTLGLLLIFRGLYTASLLPLLVRERLWRFEMFVDADLDLAIFNL